MHLTRLSVLLTSSLGAPAIFAATCESLSGLSLQGGAITLAEVVAAGAFTLPSAPQGQQAQFKQLPSFCRVAAVLRPASDSEIKIEVWMPAENWNGKFMGVGNGGWSLLFQKRQML